MGRRPKLGMRRRESPATPPPPYSDRERGRNALGFHGERPSAVFALAKMMADRQIRTNGRDRAEGATSWAAGPCERRPAGPRARIKGPGGHKRASRARFELGHAVRAMGRKIRDWAEISA